MRILFIYDGEWPKGATRVLKATRTLAADGHEIVLIARNAANAASSEEEAWMKVRRLPRLPWRPLRYALNFPFFLNPLWMWVIWRTIHHFRPNLLVACDLPLAPTAALFGKMFSTPMHFDMGEVYPEFLRSVRALERQGPLKRLIRTPKLAEWIERPVLRYAQCTYVVSEESRERALALGVEPQRLSRRRNL